MLVGMLVDLALDEDDQSFATANGGEHEFSESISKMRAEFEPYLIHFMPNHLEIQHLEIHERFFLITKKWVI